MLLAISQHLSCVFRQSRHDRGMIPAPKPGSVFRVVGTDDLYRSFRPHALRSSKDDDAGFLIDAPRRIVDVPRALVSGGYGGKAVHRLFHLLQKFWWVCVVFVEDFDSPSRMQRQV